MSKCILGANYKPVSDNQKVFCIESHLWTQPPRGVNPCDLDKLSVDVFLDDLIEFLLGGESSGGVQGVLKGGEVDYVESYCLEEL